MAKIELKPLPHREAIEYFRSKGFAPQLQRFHHLDHFREEHARDFVVAKAMRDDVLTAIREEVDRLLAEGKTVQQASADLAPRLKELGWWGRSIQTDPLTGETQEVQLGSMRRLRTIFDTNMRTAHAAGHWASIQRTKRALPYLEYVQIERPTKRHDHARFHGKIWHVDDPIWRRIYPPNGYLCGCTVHQLTEGQLRREGKTVSPPLDLEEEPWTNKRTGESFMVPAGVNPGFDGNPGAAWLDLGQDWDRMTPDLTPDRRALERGIIEGLRLRRVGDGRETLVITDAASQPVKMITAETATPDSVRFDLSSAPTDASFLHSHVSEATFSRADLQMLLDTAGHSVTAITPGGSIWRAVRTQNVIYTEAVKQFGKSRTLMFWEELKALPDPEGQEIFGHARMLWLEKQGFLTYHFRMSARVAQLMERYADLLQRLVNARPET